MSATLDAYKAMALRMAKLSYPQASLQELSQAIDYSINKRIRDTNIQVTNSYKKKVVNTTLKQVSDYVLTKRPITTAYGAMFKRHDKDKNTPFYDLLETFINNRTKFKNKMFEYPKGSDEFQKYNLLQLLAKLDCNATYGVIAQYSSMLYNIDIAGSITFQGRAYISAAITFFEQFLADNVQWSNLNEIIGFIDQVIYEDKPYKFKDEDVLDRDISLEEVYLKIMKNCGFNGWYPSIKEMNIVWDILTRVSQEDLNRLYYRNNLYEFCNNKSITKAIVYILEKLDMPFFDPNKPPASIKDELKCLVELIADYVYHQHLCFNRVDRVRMMKRKISIITDTDSTIVSFDAWYRFVRSKVDHLDLKLNSWLGKIYDVVEPDEFGDLPLEKIYTRIKPEYIFDFVSGEMIEAPKLKKIYSIEPKDNLRYTIINIMGYIASDLLSRHMGMECRNYGSLTDNRKCLIVMKNEFLFKRALVTYGKKNYASYQEMQEGHLVPKSAALDIKGMPLSKSTLKADTQQKLQNILFDDILASRNIDQIKVISDVAMVEKAIRDSLSSGEKKFYKPVTVKSHHSYANPMGIQGIKASIIYNSLKDDTDSPINLEVRNSIDIVKLNITKEDLDVIKEQFPDVYERYNALLKVPEFSKGIDYIAIPTDVEVPKWVIPMIDYDTIINDNLKNFPFDCIGINTHGRDSINYTNHVQI